MFLNEIRCVELTEHSYTNTQIQFGGIPSWMLPPSPLNSFYHISRQITVIYLLCVREECLDMLFAHPDALIFLCKQIESNVMAHCHFLLLIQFSYFSLGARPTQHPPLLRPSREVEALKAKYSHSCITTAAQHSLLLVSPSISRCLLNIRAWMSARSLHRASPCSSYVSLHISMAFFFLALAW